MVQDFNLVAQGGEQTATNDRAVAIYLYPNVQSVVTMIDSDGRITNSIEEGMDTLMSQDAIDYYEVYRHTPDNFPDLTDDTVDNYMDEFGGTHDGSITGWLPATNYYPDYLGCHFGVTNGFDMASGPSEDWYKDRRGFDSEKRNNSAFSRAHWMVIGTAAIGDSTQPDDRVDSFAIQEPLHTFVSHEISVDNNLVDGDHGEYWHEHDLGKVWSSSDPHPTGSTSAMATLWADDGMNDHAFHGPCASSTSYDGSYDQSLTSCTIDAVRYTAAEATDGD